MNNNLSYSSIYKIKETFKRSGTSTGSDFNKYDTAGHKYFKILFHFFNGAEDVMLDKLSNGGTGLLHPTWNCTQSDINNIYKNNTAYSYLVMNGELERSHYLKEFITLLSNISSESPWYFSEVSGLDAALERNIKEMKFEDERKKISIKCLPDSMDERIGTLMDLYRSIVWSWQTKREIIPSNLRKFDMGIYIFNDAIEPFHKINDEYAAIGDKLSGYKTSYKYIEFHNCEFDYNSGKTPYGTLDNKQGLSPEYTIDIYFDDCYETRYNEFMMKEFGDMIMRDVNLNAIRSSFDNSSEQAQKLSERMGYYKYNDDVQRHKIDRGIGEKFIANLATKDIEKKGGFLSNAANQLLTTATSWVDSKIKGAILGNLYTFSLTKIGDQISTLMNGGVMETANAVGGYIRDAKHRNDKNDIISGNLFEDNSITEQAEQQSQSSTTQASLGSTNWGKFDQHTKGESAIEDGNKYFNDSLDGNIFDDSVSVRHTKGDVRKEELFEEPPTPIINTYLGNMFSAQTLANNL